MQRGVVSNKLIVLPLVADKRLQLAVHAIDSLYHLRLGFIEVVSNKHCGVSLVQEIFAGTQQYHRKSTCKDIFRLFLHLDNFSGYKPIVAPTVNVLGTGYTSSSTPGLIPPLLLTSVLLPGKSDIKNRFSALTNSLAFFIKLFLGTV